MYICMYVCMMHECMIHVNGEVIEIAPFIGGLKELLGELYGYKEKLAPTTYQHLSEEQFIALFYTRPCAAWGIGLVMLVLARFDFTKEELKFIHEKLMSPTTCTILLPCYLLIFCFRASGARLPIVWIKLV